MKNYRWILIITGQIVLMVLYWIIKFFIDLGNFNGPIWISEYIGLGSYILPILTIALLGYCVRNIIKKNNKTNYNIICSAILVLGLIGFMATQWYSNYFYTVSGTGTVYSKEILNEETYIKVYHENELISLKCNKSDYLTIKDDDITTYVYTYYFNSLNNKGALKDIYLNDH